MATFYRITVFLGIILLITGEPLACNDGARLAEDGIHCECKGDSFYDAFLGKCEGVCEYFGDNVCAFYDSLTVCWQDPLDPLKYDCECTRGYEMDMDLTCFDVDLCVNGTLSCPESENQICYSEGEDYCDCMPYYYRDQEDNCQAMDFCDMPDTTGNPCEQLCYNDEEDVTICDCFEGFHLNESDTACRIDTANGYEDCQCDIINPEYGACAESSNGTQICYALPGYAFSDDETTLEDIDECETMTYQCPQASTCVNDIGGYHCECWPGYVRLEDDFVLNGCVPKKDCGDGMILHDGVCIEPCEELGVSCPETSVCRTGENNVPECSCQVLCQNSGLPMSSTFSIYAVLLYLPYENYTSFMTSQKQHILSKSMESIFGKGNAEVVEDSLRGNDTTPGVGITVEIGVSMPLKDLTVIEKVIVDHCWTIAGDQEPECVLSGGLIIIVDSVDAEEIHRCDDETLCQDYPNSMCNDDTVTNPGRFWCTCNEGFELAEDVYGVYCEDTNECITMENACEEEMVCVNNIGSYSCEFDSGALTTLQYMIDDANHQIILEQEVVDDLQVNLEDQKQKSKTIGGILGGIFGVAFIVLAVAVFYIARTRSKRGKTSGKEHLGKSSPAEVETAPTVTVSPE